MTQAGSKIDGFQFYYCEKSDSKFLYFCQDVNKGKCFSSFRNIWITPKRNIFCDVCENINCILLPIGSTILYWYGM